MHLEIAPVIRGLHCWMPVKNGVLWCPELPPSAFVASNLQKNDLSTIFVRYFLHVRSSVTVGRRQKHLFLNIGSPKFYVKFPNHFRFYWKVNIQKWRGKSCRIISWCCDSKEIAEKSLGTVGLKTWGGLGRLQSPKSKFDIFCPKCTEGEGGVTGLGNSPKNNFFDTFPKDWIHKSLFVQIRSDFQVTFTFWSRFIISWSPDWRSSGSEF